MKVPDDLLYSKSHEWVRVEGDEVTIGITDFAQDQLSDLTFVELPAVGDEINAGDEVAVVESVKAASDVYSPLTGTVTEANEALMDAPDAINSDPFGAGWLFKLKLADLTQLDGLMDPASYQSTMPAGD